MGAIRLRLAAELRSGWRSWLALALLLGVVGGVVLTAATGARRTDTAYARYSSSSHAADLLVAPSNGGRAGFDNDLRRLPEVTGLGREGLANLALIGPAGQLDPNLNAATSVDGQYGVTISRPKIVRGHSFRLDQADEVMVDPALANRFHLHPGGTVAMLSAPNDAQGNPDPTRAKRVTLRVAAIVVFNNQVVPVNLGDSEPEVLLTPAFARIPGQPPGDVALLRLRPGTDLVEFRRQLDAVQHRHPEVGNQLLVANLDEQAAKVERAIRPQATALAAFALLAGLIALAVGGQLLSRQVLLDAAEYPVLRAVGMDRRQLVALSMLRVGAAALLGAVVAVGLAIAASPLTPIGPARLAEPHPGPAANWAILAVGFLAAVLLPAAAAVPAAWRAAGRAGTRFDALGPAVEETPSRLAAALARLGWSVSGTVGVRMALEPGRGRSAVPVRSALLGTTVALAAMLAALVFGANLARLVDTPSSYGQTWDFAIDAGFAAVPDQLVVPKLAADHDVAGYAAGNYGEVEVGGQAVAAVGVDRLHGDVFPTLLDGRPPDTADEIVLGTSTLRRTHTSVGQSTLVQLGNGRRLMRVVGRAVFPNLGRGQFTPTGLGEGAAVVASLLPANAGGGPSGPGLSYNFYLVRLRPGVGAGAARPHLAAIATAAGCPPEQTSCLSQPQRPTDINNYARVRDTPLLLGAGLAVLAIATLGHVLVTAIHRRRRDFAVLRSLGFTARQVSTTVMWQSTALAVVALLFGLPLGVAAGRWIWATFASSIGVATTAAVPVAAVLVAVPATLVVANLIAAVPGWVAGRVHPALVLRTE